MFAIFSDGASSAVSSGSLLFDIASSSVSTISDGDFLSPVASCGLLSPIAFGNHLSSIVGDSLSYFVAISSFLSSAATSNSLTSVTGGSSLFPTTGDLSLLDGPLAFFLSDTPARVPHSSLFSLLATPADSAMLITRTRLFDKVFIKQKPFALT